MAIFDKNFNFLAIVQLFFSTFFFQILPFSQQRILQHSRMAKFLKKMDQNKWILYARFALWHVVISIFLSGRPGGQAPPNPPVLVIASANGLGRSPRTLFRGGGGVPLLITCILGKRKLLYLGFSTGAFRPVHNIFKWNSHWIFASSLPYYIPCFKHKAFLPKTLFKSVGNGLKYLIIHHETQHFFIKYFEPPRNRFLDGATSVLNQFQ